MFKDAFQGGAAFELLTAQGKDPSTAKWAISRSGVRKVFDKSVKGYVFACSTGGSLQLPRNDRQQLHLLQPFLVLQLLLPSGNDVFSIELALTDTSGCRRRFILSSCVRDVVASPLHTRVPLGLAIRGQWLALVLDLRSLVAECHPRCMFRSLDQVKLAPAMRLRRVFTMRAPPADTSGDAERLGLGIRYSCEESVPRAMDFPVGVPYLTQILNMAKIRAFAGDAGRSVALPESSASLRSSASASATTTVAFGRAVPAAVQHPQATAHGNSSVSTTPVPSRAPTRTGASSTSSSSQQPQQRRRSRPAAAAATSATPRAPQHALAADVAGVHAGFDAALAGRQDSPAVPAPVTVAQPPQPRDSVPVPSPIASVSAAPVPSASPQQQQAQQAQQARHRDDTVSRDPAGEQRAVPQQRTRERRRVSRAAAPPPLDMRSCSSAASFSDGGGSARSSGDASDYTIAGQDSQPPRSPPVERSDEDDAAIVAPAARGVPRPPSTPPPGAVSPRTEDLRRRHSSRNSMRGLASPHIVSATPIVEEPPDSDDDNIDDDDALHPDPESFRVEHLAEVDVDAMRAAAAAPGVVASRDAVAARLATEAAADAEADLAGQQLLLSRAVAAAAAVDSAVANENGDGSDGAAATSDGDDDAAAAATEEAVRARLAEMEASFEREFGHAPDDAELEDEDEAPVYDASRYDSPATQQASNPAVPSLHLATLAPTSTSARTSTTPPIDVLGNTGDLVADLTHSGFASHRSYSPPLARPSSRPATMHGRIESLADAPPLLGQEGVDADAAAAVPGSDDDASGPRPYSAGDAEEVDLQYDAELNCYYDPKTNRYYQLK